MSPRATVGKSSADEGSSSILRRWMNGGKNAERATKFVDVDEAAFAMEVVLEEKNKPSPQRKKRNSNSNQSNRSTAKPISNPEVAYRKVVTRKKVKSYPSKNNTSTPSSSFSLFGRGRNDTSLHQHSVSASKTSSSSFSPNSSSSAAVTTGRLKPQLKDKKAQDSSDKKTTTEKTKTKTPSPKQKSNTPSPQTPNESLKIRTSPSSNSPSSTLPLPMMIDTPLHSVANFSKPAVKRHSSEKLIYARSVLSRPFFFELDRPTIPTTAWIIHVSPLPTHFDEHANGSQGLWKYTVTLRPKVYADFSKHSPPGTSVQRSLKDFLWLESALVAEYDGALLGPSLAMAMAQPPNPDEIFTTAATWPIVIQDPPVVTQDGHQSLYTAKSIMSPSNNAPNHANTLNNQNLEQGLWDPAIEARQLLDRALYYASYPIPGISRGSEQDQSQQVPGILLQHWLQDILNGTRGRGEFYIPSSVEAKNWIQSLGWKTRNKFEEVVINVTESEAWEIFFYRKSEEGGEESLSIYFEDEERRKRIVQEELSRLVQRGFVPLSIPKSTSPLNSKLGFLSSLMESHCSVIDPLSVLRNKDKPISTVPSCSSSPMAMQMMGMAHSIKTDDHAHVFAESILTQRWSVHQRLGKQVFRKHNLHPRDFFMAFEPRTESPWHTELVETQKYITFFQREYTLQVMYRLRLLIEHELVISAAWKRFAISLSNIYACERELDKVNIGTPSDDGDFELDRPDKMKKSELDDALRVYVKQKSDRAVPSLRVLSQGVYSHYMDLCSVDASLISMDLASTGPGDVSTHRSQDFIPTDENIILMQSRLRRVNQCLNLRTARMAWIFFSIEARQAELLSSAAKTLNARLPVNPSPPAPAESTEEDMEKLEDLVKRLLHLSKPFPSRTPSLSGGHSIGSRSYPRLLDEDENESVDNNSQIEEAYQQKIEETCRLVRECGGVWDLNVANIILENIGVDLTDANMDQLSSHTKVVHKLSQNLRQSIHRCNDAMDLLEDCLIGKMEEQKEKNTHKQATQMRLHLLSSMSRLFCSPRVSMMRENRSSRWVTDYRPSRANLDKLGVDLVDVYGWLYSNEDDNDADEADDELGDELRADGSGCCGQLALQYTQDVRERDIHIFIRDIRRLLCEYEETIVMIESFIYVSAVGILAEKHFSKQRTDCLQEIFHGLKCFLFLTRKAWEKKTDIITAMNVATKKRLDIVVKELEGKLDEFDPNVSHSGVKEAKDRHLASKIIKSELETLATDQFIIVKHSFMGRVNEMIRLWTRYEESLSEEEIIPLRNFIREIELSTRDEDIQSDGGYHLIASFVLNTSKSSTAKSFQ